MIIYLNRSIHRDGMGGGGGGGVVGVGSLRQLSLRKNYNKALASVHFEKSKGLLTELSCTTITSLMNFTFYYKRMIFIRRKNFKIPRL